MLCVHMHVYIHDMYNYIYMVCVYIKYTYIYICITDICTLFLQFAGTLPQESNLAIQGEEKRGGEGIPFSKHCRTGPKSLQSLTREMGEMLSFLKLKPLLLLQLGSVCKIIKKHPRSVDGGHQKRSLICEEQIQI